MDTKDFLEAVLPVDDSYVLFIVDGEKKYNINCDTAEDAARKALHLDRGRATVYFAVGKFADNRHPNDDGRMVTRRYQHMATLFQALCADVDVGEGKPHQTQREATHAVLAACEALGMPFPTVVGSGSGVHVYWRLAAPIRTATWERVSIALRNALAAQGVALDTSKVHDPSMVLRPVGTHHKKDPDNWVEVRVVYDGGVSDVQALAEALLPYKQPRPRRPRKEKSRSSVLSAVLDGDNLPPLRLDDLRRCLQVDAIVRSGGAENAAGEPVEEPLWRATLGIAKFCDEPEQAMERLAGGHPGYDPEDNLRKMQAWAGTGPPTCAKLEQLCPQGCEGCPYKGEITSPAALNNGAPTATAVLATSNGGETEVEGVEVPRYSYKNDWLVYLPPGEDSEPEYVCHYVFVIEHMANAADLTRMVVSMAIKYPLVGWKRAAVPMDAIAKGGKELSTVLSNMGLFISNIDKVQRYFMSYLQTLQRKKPVATLFEHFGWSADEKTFLGPMGAQGAAEDAYPRCATAIQEMAESQITARGDLTEWSATTSLFSKPGLQHHGTYFLMLAGSILMPATEAGGATVNAYSRDSGSGKTFSGYFALSLWGNPDKMVLANKDKILAAYKTFGYLHNLPVLLDEVTTKDPHELRDLVYYVPAGREPRRLRADTSGFRDTAVWSTVVGTTSNRDIYEELRKVAMSEGDRMRTLQLPMNYNSVFEKAHCPQARSYYGKVKRNYGLAGPLLVDEILRRGGIRQVLEDIGEQFEDYYDFTFGGDERYWMFLFRIAHTIGKIGTELGLFQFDHEACIRASLEHVELLRDTHLQQTDDGLAVIEQYISDHATEFVGVEIYGSSNRHPRFNSPSHRSAMGRTETTWDDKGQLVSGVIYIKLSHLREWCNKRNIEYGATIQDMRDAGVRLTDNKRRALYKGVPDIGGGVNAVPCLEIDIMTSEPLRAAVEDLKDVLISRPEPKLKIV